jgi:hypothetical protein
MRIFTENCGNAKQNKEITLFLFYCEKLNTVKLNKDLKTPRVLESNL